MGDVEDGVAGHYSAYDVLTRIRAGLAEMGLGAGSLDPDVLKPVDEFHIGGAEATDHLLGRLAIARDTRVLDIGCGIGGPVRHIAARYGCPVTGIDITPAFVEAAEALTADCGMAGQVRFRVASATALPFDDRSFDLASLLHVGMNIPDKAAVFAEARRVLAPGGVFAVYEVMRVGPGDIVYPVPWAETAAISAVAAPEDYRAAADRAGFALEAEENRRDIALDFFARIQAEAGRAAPPPLGLHLLMGPTVGDKMKNMIAAIRAGTLAPVLMIFTVPH